MLQHVILSKDRALDLGGLIQVHNEEVFLVGWRERPSK